MLKRWPCWSSYAVNLHRPKHNYAPSRLICCSAHTAVPQGADHRQGGNIHADSASTPPPTAAYVHLPFCKRRCFYCDFPIQAIGPAQDAPPVQSAMQQYVEVLCREIKATGTMGAQGLKSVFFGGGTPSLMPPDMLHHILQVLKDHLGVEPDAEISMEADPGTFTSKRLQEYMALGVNRFSIGIQAFQQDVLERCGRSHGLEEVRQAIDDVHAAGVSNWSLDLISGLPGTDLATWEASLKEALAARPTHISIYDLQVEKGTKFGRYTPGQFPLPPDEVTASMFCTASQVLRAGGMEHYEICSFALPGHRCRHNLVYWHGMPHHGFGLGATSFLEGQRYARPRKMAAYKSWVAELESSGRQIPGIDLESADIDEQLLDLVMLRLRLADGLDMAGLDARFGRKRAEAIHRSLAKHIKKGLVQEEENVVRLQDPEGFLFSNDIISDVFVALDALEH